KLKDIEKQVENGLIALRAEYNKDATLEQKMNELVELCKEFGKELPNFRSKKFQTKKLKSTKENESSYEKMKSRHKKIDRCMDLMRIKELTFEKKLERLLHECFLRRQEKRKQEKKETKEFNPNYFDTIVQKMQRCLYYLENVYYSDNEDDNLNLILET
ncbi:25151_t:CDS:2, partial [Racocetra persica]